MNWFSGTRTPPSPTIWQGCRCELEKWQDAVDTLERLLDTRGTFVMGDSPALLIPLAQRDLGICEKHLGNLSKAAEYFSMVKTLWNQADSDLKNTLTQAEIPR